MYAIIELGGHQYKVAPGHRFETNRVATKVGGTHPVERVLFASDGSHLHVGKPFVAGAQVVCEVLEHHQGPKVISYKFRRRENYRKTVGHRQPLSRLLVTQILVGGKTATAEVAAPKAAAAPKNSAKPKAAAKPTAKKTHTKE